MKRQLQWLIGLVWVLGLSTVSLGQYDMEAPLVVDFIDALFGERHAIGDSDVGIGYSESKQGKRINLPTSKFTMVSGGVRVGVGEVYNVETDNGVVEDVEDELGTTRDGMLFGAGFALLRAAEVEEDIDKKLQLYKEAEKKYNEAAKLFVEFGGMEVDEAHELLGVREALIGQANTLGGENEELHDNATACSKRAALIFYKVGMKRLKEAVNAEDVLKKRELLAETVKDFGKASYVFKKRNNNGKGMAKIFYHLGRALLGQANNTLDEAEKMKLYQRAENCFNKAAKIYGNNGMKINQEDMFLLAKLALLKRADITKNQELYEQIGKEFDRIADKYGEFGGLKIERAAALYLAGETLLKRAENVVNKIEGNNILIPAKAKFDEAAGLFLEAGKVLLKKTEEAKELNGTKEAQKVNDDASKTWLYVKAEVMFSKAADLFEKAAGKDTAKLQAEALSGMGRAFYKRAESSKDEIVKKKLYVQAAKTFKEAAGKYETIGDVANYAVVLYGAGEALLKQADYAKDEEKEGLYKQAAEEFENAVSKFESVCQKADQAAALCGIGKALLKQADNTKDETTKEDLYRQSVEKFNKAADLFKNLDGKKREQTEALAGAGEALSKQADSAKDLTRKIKLYEQSVNKYDEAAKLFDELKMPVERADALYQSAAALRGKVDNTEDEDGEGEGKRRDLFGQVAKRFSEVADLFSALDEKKERQADALFRAGWALVEHAFLNEGNRGWKIDLYTQAEGKFNQAVKLNREFIGKNQAKKINLARSLYGAGYALIWQSGLTEDGNRKRSLCVQSKEKFEEAANVYNGLSGGDEVRAEAFDVAGWILRLQGDNAGSEAEKVRLYAQAAEKYNEAAEAYKRAGNKLGQAFALCEIGHVLSWQAKNMPKGFERKKVYAKSAAASGAATSAFINLVGRKKRKDIMIWLTRHVLNGC